MNLSWENYERFYASLVHEATANLNSNVQQADHFQKTFVTNKTDELFFATIVCFVFLTIFLPTFLQWLLICKRKKCDINVSFQLSTPQCLLRGTLGHFESLHWLALIAKGNLCNRGLWAKVTSKEVGRYSHWKSSPCILPNTETHDSGFSNWWAKFRSHLSTSVFSIQTKFSFPSDSIPNQVTSNNIWRCFQLSPLWIWYWYPMARGQW